MEEMNYVSLSSETLDNCEVDMQVDDHGPSRINECSSKKEVQEKKDEPELGMEFSSDEGAYKFYLNYGGKLGFNVRRNHQRKNTKGLITRVAFCCSKEGERKDDKRIKNPLYRQPITRVGCLAHMTCLLQNNGKFKVTSLNKSHNHELIRTPMKHMLRVNRTISKVQKAYAEDADKSGLPIKATMELMSKEVGGREHLGFLEKDYRNYIHKKRKMAMEKGDARAILQYFHNMQLKDSSYFYSIELDDDDQMTNIFWADARSVNDYALFGDVVCFDTTYRTNEYGRPFAPFIGVNHHKQTVVFGAALLYDETTESFRWLFETFLGAMSGKQPKTILTDQSAAMAKAISDVFFESQHRLCVWHIYQNAAKNLSHVFHGSKQFAHDFGNCVYDYEDEDEWLLEWNSMLKKYNLKENKWLKELFEVREKWAMVYRRHTFTADMKSTQRSESMNNVLKNYLKPKHDLMRFFEHYERVLDDRRYEELLADFKMMQTMPMLLTSVETLRHGAEIYTPEVFELFQKEYMRLGDYNIYKVAKEGTKVEYKVSCVGNSKEHVLKFDASTQTVICSCMKFTFIGILCVHALKVLDKKNIKRIPSQYIMKRWTRDAKARTLTNYHGIEANDSPKVSVGKRYSHLCRNFREISSLASEHETLYAYANKRALVLLNDLEDMKKELYLNNLSGGGESSVGRNEQVEMITPPNNCVPIRVCGLKRKATVGCPRSRLKGVLERRRKNSHVKTTRVSTRQKNATKDPISSNCNLEEEQGGDGVQTFNILTQDSIFRSCNLEEQQGGHGVQTFNILTQDSHFGHGIEMPFVTHSVMNSARENFGVTTNWRANIPFTQLLQEPFLHHGSLPQSAEEGNELENFPSSSLI